jgi:hypothetical protein
VNDRRNPAYAAKDQWLGKPFSDRGIHDKTLRRDIRKIFIDRLYDTPGEISSNSKPPRSGWSIFGKRCQTSSAGLTSFTAHQAGSVR